MATELLLSLVVTDLSFISTLRFDTKGFIVASIVVLTKLFICLRLTPKLSATWFWTESIEHYSTSERSNMWWSLSAKWSPGLLWFSLHDLNSFSVNKECLLTSRRCIYSRNEFWIVDVSSSTCFKACTWVLMPPKVWWSIPTSECF